AHGAGECGEAAGAPDDESAGGDEDHDPAGEPGLGAAATGDDGDVGGGADDAAEQVARADVGDALEGAGEARGGELAVEFGLIGVGEAEVGEDLDGGLRGVAPEEG